MNVVPFSAEYPMGRHGYVQKKVARSASSASGSPLAGYPDHGPVFYPCGNVHVNPVLQDSYRSGHTYVRLLKGDGEVVFKIVALQAVSGILAVAAVIEAISEFSGLVGARQRLLLSVPKRS